MDFSQGGGKIKKFLGTGARRARAIFFALPWGFPAPPSCIQAGAKNKHKQVFFLRISREQKRFFIRVWPSSRAKFPQILLLVTPKKKSKLCICNKSKNQFDKLKGFQVPLISPNALITDLYIIQSAKTYFIGLEYDYISIHESSLLLFQFAA